VRHFYDVFKCNLGFHQVTVGTELVGASLVVCLAERGKHYNFYVFKPLRITQDVEHFETAYLRHHNIGNYEVGLFVFGDN